jgi:hypothetical protein
MDPILVSIATAAAGTLAGETVKGIVAAGKLVKERFSKDDSRELVLLRAETGEVPVEVLAAAIERECAADPAFLERLNALTGTQIQVTQVNQAGQRVTFQNNFHGDGPKNVVQADTINGLNLN